MEAGLGGGRSLLQARGGYRERERERERQRKTKEKAGIYSPVEFKVEWLCYTLSTGVGVKTDVQMTETPLA